MLAAVFLDKKSNKGNLLLFNNEKEEPLYEKNINKAEEISGGTKKGFGASAGAPSPAAEPVAAGAPRRGFGFGGSSSTGGES